MTDPLRFVYPDADAAAAEHLAGAGGAPLRARGDLTVHVGRARDDAEYIRRVRDADALILGWDLPRTVLMAAPRLRVIAFTGIGAGDLVDLATATARGVTVCNTPGYADHTVAEHTLGLLLAVARHIPRLDRDLRAGQWNQSIQGIELRGLRLGLVGYGGIAACFADLAAALGMSVHAWTRNPDPGRIGTRPVTFAPLETVLARSDVVSVHVALTAATTGLIGRDAIARMRPGAILINTARGAIVDEAALIDALSNGHLSGAGLDVFAREPLPGGHPLTALDNVVLSPHVGYHTPQATRAIIDISVDNIVHFLDGAPRNVVPPP